MHKRETHEKLKPLTIMMRDDLRKLISTLAFKHEVSESDIVRKALRVGLQRVDDALNLTYGAKQS